jgi:Subtilase family
MGANRVHPRLRLAALAAVTTVLPMNGARSAPPARPRTVPAGPLRWLTTTPDDPDYAGTEAAYLEQLDVPSAWDVTTGSDDVVVAVLDSGVDPHHPDLAGRLVAGTDIVGHDDDTGDDLGHGTRMAGIVAATTNNRLGIAGVAWAGKIMPVKVAGPSGAAADRDVAAGIRWATDHGAKVINLSLGAPGGDVVLQQAVDYATTHDVVVVAAAGNTGWSTPEYPAACRGVVAVGATDADGRRASFSNYGPWVDVSGPGLGIMTTSIKPTGYLKVSGTSATTALMAGVAALVRAAHPDEGQAQVADRLRRSALGRGAVGAEGVDASGIVDALAALRLPARPWSSGGGPGTGYWLLSERGRIDAFGGAAFFGDGWGDLADTAAVDLESLPGGAGYWLLDGGGAVRPFGRAADLGGLTAGQRTAGEQAVALLGTPGGDGYWVVTDAGRVFPFGMARSFGDLAGIHLTRPIVAAAGTATGKGYVLVADDGGVFTFGDARFAGSMGGHGLNAPIRGLALDPDGSGYWLAAADGGVFAFDAPYRGSLGATNLKAPIRGMVGCGDGYFLVASDGGVFDFSNCPFAGSLAGQPSAGAVVGMTVPRSR